MEFNGQADLLLDVVENIGFTLMATTSPHGTHTAVIPVRSTVALVSFVTEQ